MSRLIPSAGPVLRGVLHAQAGRRADPQPQLPRQPPPPLRADRARRSGSPPSAPSREIEAGTADYTQPGSDSGSTTTLGALAARLAARYGPAAQPPPTGRQQYFVNPGLQLDYLSPEHPPTAVQRCAHAPSGQLRDRSARARSARRRVPAAARAANRPLPTPGNARLPRRPRLSDDPRPSQGPGRWHRGGGRTAVLYTCDAYPCPEQAQIIKTDLSKIGLEVQIKRIPFSKLFARVTTPGEPFDLAWDGWLPDYLDPQAMLNALLENSSIGPPFDDRDLPAQARGGRAALRPRALPDLRPAGPRPRPERRAAGRVREPTQRRLLLSADRLPDLRDLRHGPRRALRQARPTLTISPRSPEADHLTAGALQSPSRGPSACSPANDRVGAVVRGASRWRCSSRAADAPRRSRSAGST